MAKKLFVGNLSASFTPALLETLFEAFGRVRSAQVIMDRELGQSRGFGFVEMASDEAGMKAIRELDGSEVDGKRIVVSEARDRNDRLPRRGSHR